MVDRRAELVKSYIQVAHDILEKGHGDAGTLDREFVSVPKIAPRIESNQRGNTVKCDSSEGNI